MLFKYAGKEYKTEVKDDAGKAAEWNEIFMMPDILKEAKQDNFIVFEAYDKDLLSSDLLCFTDDIDFVDLVVDTQEKKFDLEMYEEGGAVGGRVKLTTQLIL